MEKIMNPSFQSKVHNKQTSPPKPTPSSFVHPTTAAQPSATTPSYPMYTNQCANPYAMIQPQPMMWPNSVPMQPMQYPNNQLTMGYMPMQYGMQPPIQQIVSPQATTVPANNAMVNNVAATNKSQGMLWSIAII